MQHKIQLWIVLLCLSITTTSWLAKGEQRLVADHGSKGKIVQPAKVSKQGKSKDKDVIKLNPVEVGLQQSRCKEDWNPYEHREIYWTPYRTGSIDTKYNKTKGNLKDPFLVSKPVFPEKPHTWKLDCDSGLAHFDCFTEARSVCDTFCVQQCYKHFNDHRTQEEFVDILKSVGSDGCVYRIQEVVSLQANVCRTELKYQLNSFSSAQSVDHIATVYLIEPDWKVVPLANYRRLKKAALSLPLAGKYIWDESLPSDFGNFVKAADLFDIKNCIITPSRLPYFYSDLLMDDIYRTHFGAVYSWESLKDENEGGVYTNDISYLLRPSALATLGGLPKQFIIWWPGKQPALAGENGTFSDQASLNLVFQLPPSRYFSGEGMFTIEDEHCRIPRPDF